MKRSLRGAVATAAPLAALLLPGMASAAEPIRKARIEQPVRSAAPDAAVVRASFVKVHAPLPDSVGPHPRACDWISYLRFRHRNGPRAPMRSDAVIVVIPGFLGGASNFDQVARNTIRDAARRGRHIELWALDRRANCLEDHRGVRAANRAGDASIAWGYYWGGREVAGKRFGGWVSHQDAAWLEEVGLEQTVRDWYRILQRIPGQRRRARKVFCGGHSLGGPLTVAFAGWDFDGNPRTRRDAGYKQCAAFVGFDTRFSLGGLGGGGLSPTGVVLDAATSSGSPYVDVPPLTPETFEVPGVFGVGAFLDPSGTDLLDELPHSTNIDLAQRLLFSKDAVHFATGMPSIRDFTITNELALGGVFDDNSQPLSFIRASVGFVTGGPLTDKDFPSPDPTLALPEEPSTPLYSWVDYDRVGARGAAIGLNDAGAPYTSRESEVADIGQLSRVLFEASANFIEQYFPTRILTDVEAAGNGDRSGDLRNLRHNGISRRPAILILAGDSGNNRAEDTGGPIVGDPPNGRPLSRRVTLPGYNHLDVVMAARRQNDGRAEPSSKALSTFVLRVLATKR